MGSLSLNPEIEDLATALGILKAGSGGPSLDAGFFSSPWDHISRMLSNADQRAALVSAIEGVLPPADPAALAPADPGVIRGCYPLLDPGNPGQVYIVIERKGAAPGSDLSIGIAAEMQVGSDGPSITADLVLITASGDTLKVVAGTDRYPLEIEACAPIGSDGTAVAATLWIFAPPAKSGFLFRLEGVPGTDPLVYDFSDGAPPLARMIPALLQVAIAEAGDSLPQEVKNIAKALPPLFGLTDDIPPFPFSDIVKDPGAFRKWLATLITASGSGVRPFVAWLTALGSLFDATISDPSAAGTEEDPVVLKLLEAAGTTPGLVLTAGVRTDPQSGSPVFVVGLRAELTGNSINAQVQADAVLFALPLSGTASATIFERLDLVITAPGSDSAFLISETDTGGSLAVGSLNAGVRYRAGQGGPQVVPVIELLNVKVSMSDQTMKFDRLDLTNAGTLTSAAETALKKALTDGLGSGADAVTALCTLLGLGTTPSLNMARFASDPLSALTAYYRELRTATDGWPRLLGSLGTLLGSKKAPDPGSTGTQDDPWLIDLDALTANSGSAPVFQLALWDGGDGATPRLCIALRAWLSGNQWDAFVAVQLFSIELPAQGSGAVQWLSGVRARCELTPQQGLPAVDGLMVQASGIVLEAGWSPGQKLAVKAEIRDLSVQADGDQVSLGILAFPIRTELDWTKPDLGLGLDPDALSTGIRLLLCRAIGSWAGPTESALLALIGMVSPASPGMAAVVPPLGYAGDAGLGDLLREPMAAVQTWLGRLIADEVESLSDDGQPYFDPVLDLAHALLTNRLPEVAVLLPPAPVPRYGKGTIDDPWALPLQGADDTPVEVTVWAEPYGPPISWCLLKLNALNEEGVGATELLEAVLATSPYLPWLDGLFATGDFDLCATRLDRFAGVLAGSDGMLSSEGTAPASGWDVGTIVSAAHDRVTRHPDAVDQVRARIDALTAGKMPAEWSVVLIAPRFAGADCWEALLDGIQAAERANINLRIPGVPPKLADLNGVTAATWYVVDLADDGDVSRSAAEVALGRVVDAVRRVKPTSKVILVAHSYLGLVAEAYAAANPDFTLGLIALAAPLGTGQMLPFKDRDVAEAIRLAVALDPGRVAAFSAPLHDALRFLSLLLDGYTADTASVIPSESLQKEDLWRRQATAPPDLGSVPALAISGQMTDDLIQVLANALTLAVSADAVASTPTHLSWGVRLGLALPEPTAEETRVEVRLGLKLGEIALGTAATATIPGWIDFRVRISGPGGWLVGSAGDGTPPEARIRSAEIVALLTPTTGSPRVDFRLLLHDVALRGLSSRVADLDHPLSAELLDILVRTLDDAPPKKGHLDSFLDLLSQIGLIRRKSTTAPAAVMTDALRGLRTDTAAWLGERLPALLDRTEGLLGFLPPAGAPPKNGPWRLSFPKTPIECVIEPAPWGIEVHTTGSGLSVGIAGKLRATGIIRFNGTQPEISGTLELPGFSLTRETPQSPIILAGSWLEEPVPLYPGNADVIVKALGQIVPRLLINGGITALLEQYLGGRVNVASLDGLLRGPGAWLSRVEGLGDGTLPAVDKVKGLLQILADAAGWPVDPAKPIALPGGLNLGVTSGAGSGSVSIELGTDTPLSLWSLNGTDYATLDVHCRLDLDEKRHVTPGGSLTLSVPLDGIWSSIAVSLGADQAGLRANISTQCKDKTKNGVNLTLLPKVAGLNTLLSGAEQQLLPYVLDQIVSYFEQKTPRPAIIDDVLSVAEALDIYDNDFSSKGDNLAKLLDDFVAGNIQAEAGAIATALVTVLQRFLGTGIVQAPAVPGQVIVSVTDVLNGTLTIEADISTKPVGVKLSLLSADLGAITAKELSAGILAGAPAATIDLSGSIDTGFGLTLTPSVKAELTWGVTGPSFSVDFRPLGNDSLKIPLAPSPALPDPPKLVTLAESWIIPVAGTLLLRVLDSNDILAYKLYPGASDTIENFLLTLNVAERKSGLITLISPLPGPPLLLKGLLNALANISINLPGGFSLALSTDGSRYGLALDGQPSFAVGDYTATLFLGFPADSNPWGDAGKGIGVLLLDLTDQNAPALAPKLHLGGFGIGVAREDKTPLVSAGGFQLGAVRAYMSADIPLTGAGAASVQNLLGMVELDQLGMFIGSGDNKNPVAASMVQSGSGDPAPANPPFDLMVAVDPKFRVLFRGEPVLRIEVRKTLGPLHIEEIDLLYKPDQNGPGAVGIGIDGGISVSGLSLEADGLTILVPLDHPTELKRWSLDLAGLALSFQSSSVSLSGGLRKAILTLDDGTSVVDYEGGLSVQVSGRGFSALGAYAQVKDPQYGQYASFFAFLAINMPLGGPPYLYVIGLAGGVGFNRKLLTPRDPAAVGSFPLVSAMTGSCPDPMEQLKEIGRDIPPSHGAFWLAAGVRFTTFTLLNTTALVTVSVDHGFEVTVLGLMQLQLPPAEPLAYLELALSAKYSTVDQVFSLQAALTQNSWLISKDCQLTGGFAFVIWFQGPSYPARPGSPEVVLSIGGYSKYFNLPNPNYYPLVPRVGFHWNVSGGIVVKGENFFSLTQHAIMFGGALEASYDVDPIRIWFSADLDVLIFWDPFKYFADIGVELGAQFHYDIDVWIGTITISVSLTMGALVRIEGPPLHGEATVELCIATVTVPFGSTGQPQLFVNWPAVCLKYLKGGNDVNPQPGTSASVAAGALPAPDQRDGSEDKPLAVSMQCTLHVGTKMPASGWRLIGTTTQEHGDDFGKASVDVVPCDPTDPNARVRALLNIKLERQTANKAWQSADATALDATPLGGYFPASIWDRSKLPQTDPATGKPRQNIGPSEMVQALGSVELSAGVNPEGMLSSDVPFASMIEDDLPLLPLSFGPGVKSSPLPAVRARKLLKKTPPAASEPPARGPELRKVLAAPFALRSERREDRLRKTTAKDSTPVPVPARGGHVWLLDPSSRHRIDIADRRGNIRITALHGTGGVLSDRVAAGKTAQSPAGTCRLIVTEHSPYDAAGWESETPLLYAGPATALAPGATVHAPGPWAPPSRFGRAGSACWVPAAVMAMRHQRLSTRFFFGGGAAPMVIIVRLDRRSKGARPAEAAIEIDGKRVEAARLVRSGARVEMIFPVPKLKPQADSLLVNVSYGERWRLAGVIATTGGTARWAARLEKHLHLRLVRPALPEASRRAAVRKKSRGVAVPEAAAHVAVRPFETPQKKRKRKTL